MNEDPRTDRDVELWARARNDDADAFEALVRRYYGAVYAVTLAVTGDRQDAEDACHDTFRRAAMRLEDCRSPDRFRFWLLAIARNTARNTRAREQLRRAVPLDAVDPESDVDASADAERGELRRRLSDALRELTPGQREVALLHDLEGWPHEDIARHLGISVVACRQHLFQARRRLRRALGAELMEDYRHG